jgi:hypothetical protein
MNKEVNFSLISSENYKLCLDCDISDIVNKYTELIMEYGKFIQENIKIKNNNFAKFIIIRGLETITHVFRYILYFTKNIDVTYYHCQKSFYFYVEFVSQITEEDKTFLKLTTRDATLYVYKKTIFDINNEIKKNIKNQNQSNECKEKINIVSSYINIYKGYLLKIFENSQLVIHYNKELLYIISVLTNLEEKRHILKFENILEKLYCKIENIDKFFEINHSIVEKFINNNDYLGEDFF